MSAEVEGEDGLCVAPATIPVPVPAPVPENTVVFVVFVASLMAGEAGESKAVVGSSAVCA